MPGAASLVLAWLANLINNVSSLDVICGPPVVQVKAAGGWVCIPPRPEHLPAWSEGCRAMRPAFCLSPSAGQTRTGQTRTQKVPGWFCWDGTRTFFVLQKLSGLTGSESCRNFSSFRISLQVSQDAVLLG